jgi:hypothetical protein
MNAFYIMNRVVEAGSDLVPICSPPLVYRNRRTPPIDSREVPFSKCAFRQSPHKNNGDIACENKNQTSSSFPYLSFCQVLDSFSGISLLLRPLSLPFFLWIRYLKPSSRVKCSPVFVRLRIIHHNISAGLTNTNKHFWHRCRGETVKRELLSITNLVPYFSLDFIFFLSPVAIFVGSLGSTFIYLKLHPKAEVLATRNFRSYPYIWP